MNKTRILCVLAALTAVFVTSNSAHAQVTPISIDFESPTYTDGMAPGAFPSIWSTVDTGVTVTSTGALSGAQSLLLPDGSSFDEAELYINAPDSATTMNISFLFKPTYTSGLSFVKGGGITLYNETNGNPTTSTDNHAFDFSFKVNNKATDAIRDTFDGGSSTDHAVTWTAGTPYTINLNLNFVAATVNYTVKDGATTILSNSGAFTTATGNEFVLHFKGEDFQTGAMVDSISVVSAVPEPSSYAALVGLAALGLVGWRRRKHEQI